MPQTKVASVEVGFDRQFIEKWLDRQTYVWYAIIAFLAVSLSGLLGRGPLAKRTVSAGPGQFQVTYEQFPHYKTPSTIELGLPQSALQSGHILIRLEGAVTNKAAFQSIIPQPVSANPLPHGIIADIPITAASSGARIMIFQQPSAVGLLTNRITLEGGPSLEFWQFALP
jgi:hypothetical protein